MRWFLILCLATALGGSDEKPALTLVGKTLRIAAGATEGQARFFVRGDNLGEELGHARPEVKDIGDAANANLQVTASLDEQPVAQTATTVVWSGWITVQGLVPYTDVSRQLTIRLGDILVIEPYTLTNKPASDFAWTVKSPVSVWNLESGRALEVPIITKENPVTGLKLLQSTLQSSSPLKERLDSRQLELCTQPEGNCDLPSIIAARSSQTVFLRVKNTFTTAGTFSGTVIIAADQKPDGETATLTVYSSSTSKRLLGVALILAGVVLLFFVSVVASARQARNQELIAANTVRQQIEDVKHYLKDLLTPELADVANKTFTELTTVDGSLTQSALAAVLTPYLPSTATAEQDRIARFKKVIEECTAALDRLRAVVRDGFGVAMDRWSTAQTDPAKTAAFKEGLAKIDNLADQSQPPDKVREDAAKIIADIDRKIGFPTQRGVVPSEPGAEIERLVLSTNRWTWFLWIVWIIVTTFTGAIVLVWNEPGFGTLSEYAKCFLWGFGLLLAGQQLSQITGATVAATIGIKVPKPS